MTLLDHDPIESRLRGALRRIVEDDLGGRVVTPLRPVVPRRRRGWVRPATIAAALVVVAGLVALALALRDDDDGTSVVVDEGDSGPVYVIPGPPLDTVVPSSYGDQTPREMAGASTPFVSYWGKEEDGRLTAVVMVRWRFGVVDERSGQRMVNGAPPIWFAGNAGAGALYLARIEACDGISATSHRADEADVVALLRNVTCENGALTIDGALPDGFREVSVEEVYGTLRRTVVIPLEGRQPVNFVIGEGQAREAPFLTVAPASAVQTLTIGGREVRRAFAQGFNVYRWEEGGASVALAFSGDAFTDDELESIIGGARRVTEAEWRSWLGITDEPSASSRVVVDLPDGIVPISDHELKSHTVQAELGRRFTIWGTTENGTATSALVVRGDRGLPAQDSLSTRRVVDAGGRRAWTRPAFPGTEYVVELDECGGVQAVAYRMPEPDALALLGLVGCDDSALGIDMAAVERPPGYGPFNVELLYGRLKTFVVLGTADGDEYGTFTIIEGGDPTVPFLFEAEADAVEQLDIAGAVVHRTTIDGLPVYTWRVGNTQVELRVPADDQTIERIIASARAVTDRAWREWVGPGLLLPGSVVEPWDTTTDETTTPGR